MDPDLDPSIFVIDLQDANTKLFFKTIFSAYYFLKVHLHHFSKIKSQKESQNSGNQGFSYFFCMVVEGSGSGSIPLTNGSGSGMPKKMWIRIRNRNTARRNTVLKICLSVSLAQIIPKIAPHPKRALCALPARRIFAVLLLINN
jgi:hypothetical protein